jgi:putative ABC transport system permease protein
VRPLTLPISDLARRPMRSVLTALGIAVAVGSFIAMMGLSRGVEQAWVNFYLDRGTHLVAIRKGAVEILSTSIDAGMTEPMSRIEGVRDVAGELADMVPLDDGSMILVAGWPQGSYLWQSLRLVSGRLPAADETEAVVIGQPQAEIFGKKSGDSIQILSRRYRIVGIFRQSSVMTNSTILMPLGPMQELVGRPGKVTVMNLRLARPDDEAEVAAVRARLAEAFPSLVFTESARLADDNRMLGLLRAIAWSVSVVAVAMALVIILNTLLMSVTERTREIGILSAVGWQPGRILATIVAEGTLLAAIGFVAGTILGLGAMQWLAATPPVRGFIDPAVTPRLIVEVGAGTLLLGVLGSLYPAWRAVRLSAVEALRYE